MRVYVGGTFDLFHPGHLELLRRAAKMGEVWVALNSDRYVEELKGKSTIMDYGERAAMLLACEYVNAIVCNDGNERELLRLVEPRTIVYANDGSYTRASYLKLFNLEESDLDRLGIELRFLDYTQGVSTTDIIARIQRHRGEPRQPGRPSEDAGEPDVPDSAAGRDDRACQRDCAGCPCRAA